LEEPNGQGVLVGRDGEVIEGKFSYGTPQDGKVGWLCKGEYYEGWVRKGRRHGSGVFWDKHGDTYM
jgi:hypothetical protein